MERCLIGHEIGFEKLIFGSDTSAEKIGDHIRRWDTIFDLLAVPDDARERMWWLNGAEVYGEAPVAWLGKRRAPRKRAPAPIRVAAARAKKPRAATKASRNGKRPSARR